MLKTILVLLVSATIALAAPSSHPLLRRHTYTTEGVKHTVIHDQSTNAKLDFVTNSGICETTPGVNQYSGYLDVGTELHMFFWFFEARNNPDTAPLATWFNGGPGCSSMIGLWQENGPCQFYNGSSTPSLNPYSWNNYANMLYVDSPIGTGFSYGNKGPPSSLASGGTIATAQYVWIFLQAFYKQFPQYQSRDFGIFTESYGGHYGPEFASFIENQNSAIANGSITGDTIKLVALGINNGLYDVEIQYPAYIDFAYNNSYRQLITTAKRNNLNKAFANKCLPAIQKCTSVTDTSQSQACGNATSICQVTIFDPVLNGNDVDVYDVRQPAQDPYPPTTYMHYLNQASVRSAIGARVRWSRCSNSVYRDFSLFGDWSRSYLNTMLGDVNSGIQILMWAGDADYICNYVGNYRVAQQVGPAGFNSTALQSYTVNGVSGGLYKTVGNFSWLQVYAAGHEVPYYAPALSLQAFVQTMQKGVLTST